MIPEAEAEVKQPRRGIVLRLPIWNGHSGFS